MLPLGRRLLPILQLTRMALAFTALADSLCALLLSSGDNWLAIAPRELLEVAMISIGLYGFGMSLNDIIDRRRDQQLASHRPLPSGRIGVAAAHAVCVLLALLATAGAFLYTAGRRDGALSMLIFFLAMTAIVFYDLAGKYLVAPGLLALGMIRFFNAALPSPHLPVPWQPILLLNHIALVSTVAYQWEQKRPPLTRRHWFAVLGGLSAMDAMLLFAVTWGRHDAQSLAIAPGLILPAIAAAAFIGVAAMIRRRHRNARQAGGTLMLTGLLWLIVYDASFVAGYVGWAPAGLLLCLLPVAYLSVQLMRWWSGLLALSQRPPYKRVET